VVFGGALCKRPNTTYSPGDIGVEGSGKQKKPLTREGDEVELSLASKTGTHGETRSDPDKKRRKARREDGTGVDREQTAGIGFLSPTRGRRENVNN